MRLENERDLRALIDQRLAERAQVAAASGDYPMNGADRYVLADNSVPSTVTLPSAIGRKGELFTVVRIGANAVTVEGLGAETISGATNVALASQWDRLTVVSDNANWIRVD